MTRWEYTHVDVGPGESHHDAIRAKCREGWEPWGIELKDGANGSRWRTIYFKRPDPSQKA